MPITSRSLALALPLLLVVAAPAVAKGPPWITVEYPVNPNDPETRGALFVVHTYHHGTPVGSEVTARAVGTADGRKTTLALDVEPTSRPGVFAIRGTLPSTSDWVVAVTRQGAQNGERATALVAVSAAGTLLAIEVPHRSVENGRWAVPRDPTSAEIDALLRTTSVMSEAAARERVLGAAGPSAPSGATLGIGAVMLLAIVPSGAWLRRRRSGRSR